MLGAEKRTSFTLSFKLKHKKANLKALRHTDECCVFGYFSRFLWHFSEDLFIQIVENQDQMKKKQPLHAPCSAPF